MPPVFPPNSSQYQPLQVPAPNTPIATVLSRHRRERSVVTINGVGSGGHENQVAREPVSTITNFIYPVARISSLAGMVSVAPPPPTVTRTKTREANRGHPTQRHGIIPHRLMPVLPVIRMAVPSGDGGGVGKEEWHSSSHHPYYYTASAGSHPRPVWRHSPSLYSAYRWWAGQPSSATSVKGRVAVLVVKSTVTLRRAPEPPPRSVSRT